MLKKFVYTLAAAAMTFGFAACSSDEPLAGAAGQDGLVTFTAQLPAELASRAFGEGENAKKLTVYVYEKDAKSLIETKTAEFPADGLTTTVELQLVNGKSYDILFWADAYGENGADTPFSYTASTQTVKVDYTKMASNEDKGDAFFFAEKGLEVKGAISKTIYLTRPFAQINFGTDDLDAAAVVNAFGITESAKFGTVMSKLALTAAMPDQLNLFDGTVTTTDGAAATAFAAVAPTEETFPYEPATYDYMSMSYVLVGADRDVVDLKYTVLNGDTEYNTLEIAAVPVQRNYRTNIYGSLITSKVNFTVEIKPGFTDSYGFKVWDGKVTEPEINVSDKTINISTPAELAGLSKMVKEKNPNIVNCTITLQNDIDLANLPWDPIGDTFGAYQFNGTFDGNGKVIKNVYVDRSNLSDRPAGLFGSFIGVIKNVIVDNATITGSDWVGGIAGYAEWENTRIENCEVRNSSITGKLIKVGENSFDGANKVGGIVGYTQSNETVTGCKVNGSYIEGYRYIGGIVGYVNTGDATTVSGCTVENTTVIQNFTNGYKDYSTIKDARGPIIGYGKNVNSLEWTVGNTANNVKVETKGQQQATQADYAAALAAGGDVTIDMPVEALDITAVPTADLNLVLAAPVTSLKIGRASGDASTVKTTITVPRGVKWPALDLPNGNVLRNTTFVGDPTDMDNALTSGISARNKNNAVLENITFDGVPMKNKGIDFTYSGSANVVVKDITIKNCVAEDLTDIFFGVQWHNNNSQVGNFTIENNKISYSSATPANINALYLLNTTLPVTVKGNVINAGTKHGIFLSNNEGGVTIEGNNITVANGEDGIKFDQLNSAMTITGNTIKAKEFGIRCARFDATEAPTVTITGNTLNLDIMKDGCYGIYVGDKAGTGTFTGSAVVKVSDNKKAGSYNGDAWFAVDANFTPAAGSDVSAPYAE